MNFAGKPVACVVANSPSGDGDAESILEMLFNMLASVLYNILISCYDEKKKGAKHYAYLRTVSI